jgi:hypothetical protein
MFHGQYPGCPVLGKKIEGNNRVMAYNHSGERTVHFIGDPSAFTDQLQGTVEEFLIMLF